MAEVLLVGAGGIGAPAAWALAEAGIEALVVVDDDRVEVSNLHRQVLFDDADVGRPKLAAFAEALSRRYPAMTLRCVDGRVTPETVSALVSGVAVIVDATDNFATRFLLADAALLASVPVVHAAAVQWRATVMATGPLGGPCYRCLFEDIPSGEALDCATAGVAGPVCGVSGALAADAVLAIARGSTEAFGRIVTYDGFSDRLRTVEVASRSGCPLCGTQRDISSIVASRYTQASCSN